MKLERALADGSFTEITIIWLKGFDPLFFVEHHAIIDPSFLDL
jgi:hypothetical protein